MPDSSFFRFEWQPAGADVRAPELAATWARLELDVSGSYPTVVEDLASGSIRRSISVPLYPLAEWVTYNWWSLLYGVEKGASAPADGHNVRAAGDGFLWPNLSIRSEGGRSRLTWQADIDRHAGWPIRFLTSGAAWVETEQLRSSFTALVDATLVRLDEAGQGSTILHKEWQVLKELDGEEVEFCEACGRLGLDPFAEGASFSDAIGSVFERLDESNRDDFLDAVAPDDLARGLAWVDDVQAAAQLSDLTQGSSAWGDLDALRKELRRDADLPQERAFEVGYRQARLLRQALSLSPREPVRLEQLPVVRVRDLVEAPSRSLQGVSVAAEEREQSKLVLGWPASPQSVLFASTRCFWNLLFEPGEANLLTTAPSRRQQVSRAFAAEFLAPAEGIRELTGGRGTIAWSSPIADLFGVSDEVIERQVENQLQRSAPA